MSKRWWRPTGEILKACEKIDEEGARWAAEANKRCNNIKTLNPATGKLMKSKGFCYAVGHRGLVVTGIQFPAPPDMADWTNRQSARLKLPSGCYRPRAKTKLPDLKELIKWMREHKDYSRDKLNELLIPKGAKRIEFEGTGMVIHHVGLTRINGQLLLVTGGKFKLNGCVRVADTTVEELEEEEARTEKAKKPNKKLVRVV